MIHRPSTETTTQHPLPKVLFVTGIDTDAGKSYATAYLAKKWSDEGKLIITQKFIQTGNVGYSEDIELHRRLMGIDAMPEDLEGLTYPEVFSYPASPLLASRLDGREIDFAKIERATQILTSRYDCVLLEGAGGVMVPLTQELLTIDYVQQREFPLLFVTSGKLGSVNHTLLSLEAIARRGIELHTVAYNLFPTYPDTTIQEDTKAYLINYLTKHFPHTQFVEIPVFE